MTEVLVRLVVGLTFAVVGLVAGAVRLGLRLLGLAGFRGARLAGLAATLAGVRWAAGVVGTGPALRLALIGWAAWVTRHHRAAIRRHAAVRRLATAQQAAVRRLTAALEQHAAALEQHAKRPQIRRGTGPAPASATAPKDRGALPVPPWQAAERSPAAEGVAALGRYAAAWARHHAAPKLEEQR